MKALKAIALAGLMLAAQKASALVDISGFGGYTTLGMGDINKGLDNDVVVTNGTEAKMQSGFYVGADAGFTAMPFLKIGPRLEYVQANTGSVTYSGGKDAIDANLLLMEVGVTVDTSIPMSGFSVLGGVWGGYGLAGSKITLTSSGVSDSVLGNGSGFVGEVGAQLRYGLMAGLSIGLDLGYRLADITNMEVSADNPAMSASKGQPMVTNADGSKGAFDYSGLNIGGAISFNF
jgi:hypothetical protein